VKNCSSIVISGICVSSSVLIFSIDCLFIIISGICWSSSVEKAWSLLSIELLEKEN